VWESIDQRMDSRRKDQREARHKQEIEKYRASNPERAASELRAPTAERRPPASDVLSYGPTMDDGARGLGPGEGRRLFAFPLSLNAK
jgi:hypothetical protein